MKIIIDTKDFNMDYLLRQLRAEPHVKQLLLKREREALELADKCKEKMELLINSNEYHQMHLNDLQNDYIRKSIYRNSYGIDLWKLFEEFENKLANIFISYNELLSDFETHQNQYMGDEYIYLDKKPLCIKTTLRHLELEQIAVTYTLKCQKVIEDNNL